jgi:hypothetical protein
MEGGGGRGGAASAGGGGGEGSASTAGLSSLGRVTTTGPGIFSLLGTALGGGAGAGGGPAAFNNNILAVFWDTGSGAFLAPGSGMDKKQP